jgi:prepilin-type N-terminal cleavage/methylation domain-containing protein
MQKTRFDNCAGLAVHAARPAARGAFSLIELVVVVVIIGIIAAIAIPKMSKGAQGAADSALTGDLKILRQAIDMYVNEHGGTLPDPARIATQLTQYSNSDGTLTSPTKDTGPNQIIFGPYLRAVPTVPVGGAGIKNLATIGLSTAIPAPGWFYDGTAGTVTVNSGAGTDSNGNTYSNY